MYLFKQSITFIFALYVAELPLQAAQNCETAHLYLSASVLVSDADRSAGLINSYETFWNGPARLDFYARTDANAAFIDAQTKAAIHVFDKGEILKLASSPEHHISPQVAAAADVAILRGL